jgi:hypothetical protein
MDESGRHHAEQPRVLGTARGLALQSADRGGTPGGLRHGTSARLVRRSTWLVLGPTSARCSRRASVGQHDGSRRLTVRSSSCSAPRDRVRACRSQRALATSRTHAGPRRSVSLPRESTIRAVHPLPRGICVGCAWCRMARRDHATLCFAYSSTCHCILRRRFALCPIRHCSRSLRRQATPRAPCWSNHRSRARPTHGQSDLIVRSRLIAQAW